jgi:hypothetical protein
MNALPRLGLGRATTLLGSVADQRAADPRVMADVDTASDLRDAAARLHAAVSQAEFNVEPPVDLTLLTQAAAGLAAVDLDAYQRRIGDRVAGLAGRLDPNHADDTGILDSPAQSPAPDWFECQHDLTTITTGLFAHPHRPEITLLEIHTEARNRLCGPKTIGGLEIEVSEQWMRQMRALIDRALGDRT